MRKSAIKKVKISDTGMEYRTPSNPKNIGNNKAKPTPNTISLTMESIVDSAAFPMACKKMKQDLFTQAKINIHK